MSINERRKRLEIELASKERDDVVAMVTDLIFEFKDQNDWTDIELEIVSFANFDRWMLNGGIETYLLMPASVESASVHRFCLHAGLFQLAEILKNAVRLFQGIDWEDVDARQSFKKSNSMEAALSEIDEFFYDNHSEILDMAINYLIRSRGEILA